MEIDSKEAEWKTSYYLGALCVFTATVVMLAEIFITALPDGAPVQLTSEGLLEMYNRNWFMGMRYMGLMNMISSTLLIPVFFSLFGAHRNTNGVLAAFALVIALISYAVFLSDNVSFPILLLSKKYTMANEIERTALITATEALFSKGASHTPGTFPGFLLGQIGSILFCIVIIIGRVFKKRTGIIGLIAFVFLLIFEVISSFMSSLFKQAMIFAMIGGISAIVWFILVGVELTKHAKKVSQ